MQSPVYSKWSHAFKNLVTIFPTFRKIYINKNLLREIRIHKIH